MTLWDPHLYLAFEAERTQPAIDLARRVEVEAPARVIDIGCGPGNSTAVLRRRWPQAEVVGLDSSEAMIEQARLSDPAVEWLLADATADLSSLSSFDVVFSNAVIQWIEDQPGLLAKLFGMLRDGGVLASQVPYVQEMPIHLVCQEMVSEPGWRQLFGQFTAGYSVHPTTYYYNILCRLTSQIALWSTDYYAIMPNHQSLVEWYSGTGLRPYLAHLPDDQVRTRFLVDYQERLVDQYPLQSDGNILFPFTRIFFLAHKGSNAGEPSA